MKWRDFRNEPDTDFVAAAKRRVGEADRRALAGARRTMCRWSSPARRFARIASNATFSIRRGPDESSARGARRTTPTWNRAVACARRDDDGWRTRALDERSAILGQVAQELRGARGDSDRRRARQWREDDHRIRSGSFRKRSISSSSTAPRRGAGSAETSRLHGRRAWSSSCRRGIFQIAIPCGGIAAALAAGNTVIPQARARTPCSSPGIVPGASGARAFRERTLQFLPCPGSGPAPRWCTHAEVDAVIFTGGTETALRMLAAKPALRLLRGDRREERHDRHRVVRSRAGHQATFCTRPSATAGRSVPRLRSCCSKAEIYDDPEFRDGALAMPCKACASVPPRISPHASARSFVRPSGDRSNGRSLPRRRRRRVGRATASASAAIRTSGRRA